MATAEQFFVIILDGSSQAERDAVHARVKKASSGSWHKYSEVWIVRGGTGASEWMDRLRPVIKVSSLLVLALPEYEGRHWAYYGPDAIERAAWLHKNYTKDSR
jgi:hypothetical protein